MDYRFHSFMPHAHFSDCTPFTVEWYDGKKLLYRKIFYGTVNYGVFCLVTGVPFDFKKFKNFIDDIIDEKPSNFEILDNYGSYEAYEYDNESNKLIVSFGIDNNLTHILFDVNESMIDLLDLMYNSIKMYNRLLVASIAGIAKVR